MTDNSELQEIRAKAIADDPALVSAVCVKSSG